MRILYSSILFLCTLSGCTDSNQQTFQSENSGDLTRSGECNFVLSLTDDNLDSSLPYFFRNWWFTKLEKLPARNCSLRITNRGWPFSYLPVYSYDNENWFKFDEGAVRLEENGDLYIETEFEFSAVYVARYYPYTEEDLRNYLEDITGVEVVGYSESGRELYLITAGSGPDAVWVQARNHPGETEGSYIVEGIISQVKENPDVTFYIAPMVNVDGVIEGNYRTTPGNLNLEREWSDSPRSLEVETYQNIMRFVAGQHKRVLALNLHSANTPEGTASFAFLHFAESLGEEENRLYQDQEYFLSLLNSVSDKLVERNLQDREFLGVDFPETWWWFNYGARVTAITLETTYSYNQEELRLFGASIAEASLLFYEEDPFEFGL